jgi:hypothetical protein
LIAFGQLRIEIGEHVQIGAQRGAVVHIVGINAGPEECFAALDALQAFQIDAAIGEQFLVFGGEVVAHHGDNLGLGKITGGQTDISAAPPNMRSTLPCGVSTPS